MSVLSTEWLGLWGCRVVGLGAHLAVFSYALQKLDLRIWRLELPDWSPEAIVFGKDVKCHYETYLSDVRWDYSQISADLVSNEDMGPLGV